MVSVWRNSAARSTSDIGTLPGSVRAGPGSPIARQRVIDRRVVEQPHTGRQRAQDGAQMVPDQRVRRVNAADVELPQGLAQGIVELRTIDIG